MKLRSSHIFDPEPKPDDFTVPDHVAAYGVLQYEEQFFKALTEWKRRNVKPKLEDFYTKELKGYLGKRIILHSEALTYHEENRQRWKGFEVDKEYKNQSVQAFKSEKLTIRFYTNASIIQSRYDDGFNYSSHERPEVEFVKALLSENNITLIEI